MESKIKKKALAGYHILMILSAVDGEFSGKEDMVIEKWMEEQFPPFADLDREMEVLSAMPPTHYMIHFQHCMDEFYRNSTEHERNELIQFALDLVKADKKITDEENIYVNKLFRGWTEPEN